jgi:hypothetical protein
MISRLTAERTELLARCEYSDRDCVDHQVLFTRQPRRFQAATMATAASRLPWPAIGYSCDFCSTRASFVGQCVTCRRWVGLSMCNCANDSDRVAHNKQRTASSSSSSTQTIVDDRPVSCGWCATARGGVPSSEEEFKQAPPVPCGFVEGQLKRVVFVLEPTVSNDAPRAWHFEVAQRMLTNVLENVGIGSVLFYSIRCECAQQWQRALALVCRFAATPSLFLPSDCRFDASGVEISVLLAMHGERRGNSVLLDVSSNNGKIHSLSWWLEMIDKQLFGSNGGGDENSGVTRFKISDIYFLTCQLFPDIVLGERNATLFRALADKHDVVVMAADGNVLPYLQVTLLLFFFLLLHDFPS